MDRRLFAVVALVGLVVLLCGPAIAVAAPAELDGVVKVVDAVKKTVTVTDADGKDVVVSYSEVTVITKDDGTKGAIVDVRKGAKATVTHDGGKASKIVLKK